MLDPHNTWRARADRHEARQHRPDPLVALIWAGIAGLATVILGLTAFLVIPAMIEALGEAIARARETRIPW